MTIERAFRRIFLFAALALPACGGVAAAQERITILTAAPATLPAFAAAQLAKAKGYFAAEGITVEFVTARGGVDVGKQIGAGNAEVGYILGDAPILLRPNGVPIKLVALFGGGGFSFLVAREDSGIAGPADLKGKTVAALSFQDTATYYVLLGALASVGLKASDLDIQAVGPTLMWQNVATGKAHACSCPGDFVPLIEATGTKVRVIPHDRFFPAMSHGLGVSDKLIAEKPRLVAGIVRAVTRGAEDMRRNPDTAAADFIAALPEWKGREHIVLATIRFYASTVYAGQKTFGETDPDRMAKLQDFYFENQVIQKKSPVDELYTNQFIK